jgi:dipeptidyl aminopeptidase/acylaminoacyl peptidase
MILVYPVIIMGKKTHSGTRDNLLGKTPSATDLALLSNEQQVTAQTPPTFLAHSKLDGLVPVENSAIFHAALLAHHVPSEFLELETGDHGLGCGQSKEWEMWQAHCLTWLQGRGLAK